MATWAIIRSGRAYEVVEGDTVAGALAGKRAVGWIAINAPLYVSVPDGCVDGATVTLDGAGAVTAFEPPVSTAPLARDLTEAEFVKLGIAVNMTGINSALKDLPVFAVLLRQYTNQRGLRYEDAVTANGNTLNTAIATIVAGGYFTTDQRDAFLAAWRSNYPAAS